MTDGRIKFSTQILKRLGEELNPSMDQGVLELVKNAYDADARNCSVRISNPEQGGEIVITDDGSGMEPSDIVSGWLVLGASKKTTQTRTPLGRVPAGNKGLGRLAALRLGSMASLSTVSSSSSVQTDVELNWDAFDSVDLVEDVPIPLHSKPTDRAAGTQITISGLRNKIGRAEVKRLARAMILLADPFGVDKSGFRPILETPEFSDLERLVARAYFSEAEYRLTARLSAGRVTAEVRDWKGEILWSAEHGEISSSQTYEAPDAEFELWSYSLNSKTFSMRSSTIKEVRDWLSVFGGVHLYSNGLRISPYGNPGNDWLDMNLSRVRSPEERPSTNNSIGRVLLHDTSGLLLQKTDRSGVIESHAFDEIRRFAVDSLEWMARRRLARAESRRQRQRQEAASTAHTSKSTMQEEIQKLPSNERTTIASAFESYAANRDRREEALNREVQLYRTLSTAGITTAVFAHESNGGGLKIIVQALNSIEFRVRKRLQASYEREFAPQISSIRKATESLGVLSSTTLRLLDQDKRRVGRVDLHAVILDVIRVFEPFIVSRDVRIELSLCSGKPYIHGSEAAIESVLTNLLNNSLTAFERNSSADKVVEIATSVSESSWLMAVSDTGPGIEDISTSEVWLPGQTRRHGGTGLGLTIVKDAVTDLNGKVKAIARGHLGGATFEVRLPLLGVEEVAS